MRKTTESSTLLSCVRRLPDYRRWPVGLRYGLAVAVIAFVTLTRMALPVMGLPFLMFIPALMAVGFLLGFGPGVLATLTATLAADFLFVGQRYSLELTHEEWVASSLFCVVNMAIVAVCVGLRRSLEQFDAFARTLEERVEERTRERDQIWQATPDLLCTRTADGYFVNLNPAWERLLGWSVAELEQRPFTDFLHPEDVERTRDRFASLEQDGPVLGFENRYRHRDGSYRWLSWNSVLRDGRVYSTVRDITAQKAQGDVLRQTEEALRHSQKMEAVGQLTGGLAHDFNNLLTGISGSLQLIQARLTDGRPEDIERYLQTAQTAANRAASLTHRLLAFSRRQTLDPRPTRLKGLVVDMLDLIERTVGPQIALRTRLPDDVWVVRCDAHQLESALLNLCINARDAMPGGGDLTIVASNLALDDAAAARERLAPGDYVALEVSDTGTGMSADVAARAFDPFFTTKPTGMGTGLGLSMIYGFAEQSGGRVNIRSALGAGTTVRLLLPRHEGPVDAEAPTETTPPPAVANENLRVLVVDDEPLVRMLILEVLGDLGYATEEAGEAATALKIIDSDVPLDLMITDVGLPGGMNGRQLADAARARRGQLKVLFITGYAEGTALGDDDLESDMHLMTKPFAMDALATRIETIMRGHTPVPA